MHRYTFEQEGPAQVLLDMMANIYDYDGKNVWTFLRVENDTLVTGYRQTTGWARTRTVYFAMDVQPSRSPPTGTSVSTKRPTAVSIAASTRKTNFPEMAGREIRAHFDFEVKTEEPLLVKVALSPVSTAGALRQFAGRSAPLGFRRGARARPARRGTASWAGSTSRPMTEDQRSIFYTALYHTMLGPIVYEDVDGSLPGAGSEHPRVGRLHQLHGLLAVGHLPRPASAVQPDPAGRNTT